MKETRYKYHWWETNFARSVGKRRHVEPIWWTNEDWDTFRENQVRRSKEDVILIHTEEREFDIPDAIADYEPTPPPEPSFFDRLLGR